LKIAIVLTLVALGLASCAGPEERKADARAAAAAAPSCKSTPKELVVKDIAPGSGRTVVPHAAILVNYTGWLYDGCKPDFKGAEFDSSRNRATPFGFMVGAGRVIKGWDEGVIGMHEHEAKRLLIIPPDKAYGEKGAGDRIPPNAALVFEIEMVQIVYHPTQPPEPEKK
jgi:FKBP-type peptidyl-prolyl cis-trans isomerase